ncbi:hypothetical protein N431DRAFT_110243 [Stipitochalara longipes BDJ]|nr:hypothetical protein N431DRAFT_110243 [Stipitochalara longipes BDJ]
MPLEFQKQSNRSVRSVNDIGIAAAHDVIMPERRLVIAIDYGTTYTGIAYAYTVEERASLNEIDVVQDWGPRMGNHQKIPSVISYSLGTQNHERQWGADLSPQAVAMVHTKLQLDVEDTSEELDLILQALDGMHNLDFRYIVESKGAPRYTSKGPEEIVTDYLNRVFEYLLEAVFQPAGLRTLPVEIVVTVPPYWSYKAKNSLFRALTQAGFNNTNFPLLRRIMLVAEPEAAAIYTARYLRERSGGDMLKKGESFVLCDAGGGTVDVISYRVKQLHPTFEIECVTIPTGSKCGSIFINLAFKKWLRDLLGEKLYKLLDPTQLFTKIRSHDAEREGMRELMKRFDVLKKRFTKSQGSMTLDLPAPLENLELDSRVIGGEIEITYDDMARFFEPCVSRIIELIAVQQEQLEDLRMGLKNVFLVGGFAESPYLQESIMEHLNMRGLYLNSIETSTRAKIP